LIVDLDQTIIHTTVDPTVGEWMAEIEEDDEREDSDPAKPSDEDEKGIKEDGAAVDEVREDTGAGSTTPPTTPRPRKQPTKKNPNAAALKDVARFQLADDLPPGYRAQGMGRWYYTKPRSVLCLYLSCLPHLFLDPPFLPLLPSVVSDR
jgi:RNA polymerase II subunit A-like phosphatase